VDGPNKVPGPDGATEIARRSRRAGGAEHPYEPLLIQRGFLHRTPRGRQAPPSAYRHLGFTPPVAGRGGLFE